MLKTTGNEGEAIATGLKQARLHLKKEGEERKPKNDVYGFFLLEEMEQDCIVHEADGALSIKPQPVASTALLVFTTAVVSSLYFGGHQDKARQFMKMTAMIPGMLDKSRFNRVTCCSRTDIHLRKLHAVTFKGWLLKITLFIFAFTLNKMIP